MDLCHNDCRPLATYILPTPSLVFTLNATISGDAFRLAFTNPRGTHFRLLATTALSLPSSSRALLGAAVEGTPGSFQFTDVNAAGSSQRFFRVRSPGAGSRTAEVCSLTSLPPGILVLYS